MYIYIQFFFTFYFWWCWVFIAVCQLRLVALCRILIAAAFLVAEHELTGSGLVVHTCRIFPGKLNPCPVDSQTLD